MKKLKYIIGLGALMLLTSFFSVSCTDGNDWDVDSSHDRLFSVLPTSISLSAEATTAELKWTRTPDTEYYIIEVSSDSLYNDIPMGGNNSIVFGEDKSITNTPYVLTGLEGNSKYFLRIKAISSLKEESKWSYPSEKKSFNTTSEQIFYTITDEDLEATKVTLRWPAGQVATKIILTPGNITHTVTADDITKGSATIENLTNETAYTAVLMNGEKLRGTLTFQTPLDLGGAIQVNPNDNLSTLIASAKDNDVFALMPGEYKVGTLSILKNVAIKAAKPLNKPILKAIISIEAGVSLELKDLILDGTNAVEAGKNADQAIQFNTNDVSYQNITIDGCEIRNYLKGLLYFNVKAVAESITINNSILYNIVCDGGDFFDCRKGTAKTINFTKNTVYNSANSARDFFRIDNENASALAPVVPNIIIDKNTFYNISNNSGKRILYVRWIGNTITFTNNLVVGTKVIFSDTNDTAIPSFSKNNYFEAPNLLSVGSTKGKFIDASGNTLDPQFKDAANGDFTVQNSSVSAGDPRWLK